MRSALAPLRWTPLVFGLAALLYGLTCAPSLLWQDSGWIQYRVHTRDLAGFFGLALAHPLYYLLALPLQQLAPGHVTLATNLISAAAAALTVTVVFHLALLWTQAPLPSLVAAAALALSHTFWRHACIAETYTLWTLFFSLELLGISLYLRHRDHRGLFLAALANGLGLSTHMLSCLVIPVYVIALIGEILSRRLRPAILPKILCLWILGLLPILTLLARESRQLGGLAPALHSLAFGTQWRDAVLNTQVTWPLARANLLYIGLNFPDPLLLLALAGWLALLLRRRGLLVWALGLIYLGFACRYTVVDRYAFLLPFYLLTALVLGWSCHRLLSRCRTWGLRSALVLSLALPPLVYGLLPGLIDLGTRGDVPYRDDDTYFLRPWKTGYRGAERFATEALAAVEPNAVILADLTTAPPLLLAQSLGARRPDVAVISAAVSSPGAPACNQDNLAALLQERPVYVVSRRAGYCPDFLRNGPSLTRAGLLWRVRAEAGG